MKLKLEVRKYDGQNVLFINDQLFDWGVDQEAVEQIKKITNKYELKSIHESIKEYLLESLETYTNKKITIGELLEGIKVGYIEI